jgi:hypothetical protein
MLTWIRQKFGTVVIGLIILLIAFVFVFADIVRPGATQGMHEGAVAGEVNGDYITRAEYSRALNQRIEFFKNLFGGQSANVEQQIRNMRVHQSVFDDLVRRKVMVQEATRQGLLPSDEEIRDRIREMEPFKQDGRFDVMKYRGVLANNGYTPESFERLMREDLASEQWTKYFESRVHVSDAELKREFEVSQNKRNIKYVLLTAENGRKGIQVSADDVQKFLADAAKLNLARNQYEARKEAQFKGKTFDQAKETIARDLIAVEKHDEVMKFNEQLAARVQQSLTASKTSDAQVNSVVKPYGTEVRTTGWVTAQGGGFLPGVGEAKELVTDAFAPQSPIESKAKIYRVSGGVMVAVVGESQNADTSKFEGERNQLARQVHERKLRMIQEAWMKKLMERSKIVSNPAIVTSGES